MASLRKRNKVWYYRFTDADGIKRECKGCTDKRATEEMARAAETEAAKIRAGLSDPFEAHRKSAIEDHVTDYLGFLRSEGNTPKHVALTSTRLRAVLAGCEVYRIGDLNAARISGWLAQQRAGGMSAATSNYYLQAVAGFVRWLVKHRRMADNPLAPLGPVNIKVDRRHDRGSLSQEEFEALIRSTRPAKAFRGLTGHDRTILYLVASYTGLRASELATLTPAGFHLDGDQPTVRVRAAYTKNRTEAVLPLRPDLVEILRPYLKGRAPDATVWPGTWVERSARMLRQDLERAGIAYVDPEGGYRDFHSLRHRLGSELARANVAPKVAQSLMRHSTITLTLDRYAHIGLFDTAGALEKLPPVPDALSLTDPRTAQATGTDGQPISNRFAHYLPTGGDGSGRNESDSDAITESYASTMMG